MFGAQYLAHHFGGEVKASNKREYGRANLAFVDKTSKLFKGIGDNSQVWMSHGDTIEKLPAGCQVIASTKDVKNAAFKVENEITYGIQFHPEVYHVPRELVCFATLWWVSADVHRTGPPILCRDDSG